MMPCLFTCMFQVKYYLIDFDEILCEQMPKPVFFNFIEFVIITTWHTQTCEVWATLALLSKFSNQNDQSDIGTKFVLNIVDIQNN